MRYYIDTIEQTKGDNDTINEYGKREIQAADKTFEEVQAAYFTKLANVANDIGEGKNHYFMDIKIVNSLGGILEKKQVGEYKEADAQ